LVADKLDLNTEWGKKYNEGQKLRTQETLALLRSRLNLRPVRNTMLIDIQVYGENPAEAAKLANSIAESYRQFRLEQGRALSSGGVESLQVKLKEQDEKIRKAKEELTSLRTNLNISDIDAVGTGPQMLMEAEQYRKYEQTRFERELIYNSRKQEYDSVIAFGTTNSKALREVLPRVQIDQALSELLNNLNAAEQRAKSLSNDVGPKNPELTRINEQIVLLNEQIDSAVAGIIKSMETRVVVAKAGLDDLVQSVEEARLRDSKKLTEGIL
jgi:succinoglycan biosynthesis transport protein ExoP